MVVAETWNVSYGMETRRSSSPSLGPSFGAADCQRPISARPFRPVSGRPTSRISMSSRPPPAPVWPSDTPSKLKTSGAEDASSGTAASHTKTAAPRLMRRAVSVDTASTLTRSLVEKPGATLADDVGWHATGPETRATRGCKGKTIGASGPTLADVAAAAAAQAMASATAPIGTPTHLTTSAAKPLTRPDEADSRAHCCPRPPSRPPMRPRTTRQGSRRPNVRASAEQIASRLVAKAECLRAADVPPVPMLTVEKLASNDGVVRVGCSTGPSPPVVPNSREPVATVVEQTMTKEEARSSDARRPPKLLDVSSLQNGVATPRQRISDASSRASLTRISTEAPVMNASPGTRALEVPEDGYTIDFLQDFCGEVELSRVTKLDIQVDSAKHSVEALGDYLPRLQQLRLNDSSVLCLRELGSGLQQLEVLWMSRCGLQDLDGIALMPSLRELYLPFNDVVDVQPITALDHLAVLDLEGNALACMSDLDTLWISMELRELNLVGNPLCHREEFSREAVFRALPQLEVLNDEYKDSVPPNLWGTDREVRIDAEMYLDLYIEVDDILYLHLYLEEMEEDDERVSDLASDPPQGVCTGPRPSSARSRPMSARGHKFAHPLLVKGLSDSEASFAVTAADVLAGEPDEHELLLERVKRSRPRAAASQSAAAAVAAAAVAAGAAASSAIQPHSPGGSCTPRGVSGGSGSFNLRLADRRSVARVGAFGCGDATNAVAVPSAVCRRFTDSTSGTQEDASSALTCGASLAGNPLMAARQRRSQAASSFHEGALSIRELLRCHQV
eukprot:TRINITY_DN40825_c0_g1_i1.p1 TRINITY_DN40825_c0_g1~~TRINITY_DN40825_c0_g1_i1.p1  ORF type:complete len:790 (+),score=113.76 TRINITY_DN40825_c0_g1_i1:80-2449(+)